MRAILTLLTFMTCVAVHAGNIVWSTGSVVLAGNKVVVGDLARQGAGLLLLKDAEGAITVFPAHRVNSFRYYDAEQDVNRVFVAVGSRYFERVVYGKISVLRIQKFFDQKIDEKHPAAHDYFVEEKKRITTLKSFRKKYFDRIKEELDLRLVSYRHLDPNTSHGAVSLILLYNKLPSSTVVI